MSKTLIIAEKPSVGRDIARVVGADKKGDGCLFSDKTVVSWAVGHLVTLCEPEDYDISLKPWRRGGLPVIPAEIKLKPIQTTVKQLNILEKLMNGPDIKEIICATDAGREGELIFRYIYSLTKCQKPFKRLWISSMTDAAIKAGFAALKPGSEYDNLYMSAKCRSEADWLVGINATRAFTIRYDCLLSVGRVQTPTLAILAERQKEINAFVPSEYFEVTAVFETYKGKWFDYAEDGKTPEHKIPEKDKADEIVEKVRNGTGEVISIDNEEKRQVHPLLYDLTELQKDCNSRFGFSAQKTLTLAQDLYEKKKLITYPRTDSKYLSDDMVSKLPVIASKLAGHPDYKRFTDMITEYKPTSRFVDNSKVSDHHAIIPTEKPPAGVTLTPDERKVYDLVARRFLSVFFPHYIYNVTKIITSVYDEKFLTKGITVIQQGWMLLYEELNRQNKPSAGKKKKDEDDEDGADALPDVHKGQTNAVTEVYSEAKKTKPPKAYTESSLLSAMEHAGRFVEDDEMKEQMKDLGLGTPATRAAIIERLLAVGYIERKGKSLIPTDKGMKLIEVVPEELKSPMTTGKWEKGLVSISKGTMQPERFMGSIERYVRYIVSESDKSSRDVKFPERERPRAKKK